MMHGFGYDGPSKHGVPVDALCDHGECDARACLYAGAAIADHAVRRAEGGYAD